MDALRPREATDPLVVAEVAAVTRDEVLARLRLHPLPWTVERDWTYEVTAPGGAIVAKCMTPDLADAVIALATQLHAEAPAAE